MNKKHATNQETHQTEVVQQLGEISGVLMPIYAGSRCRITQSTKSIHIIIKDEMFT